MQDKLLDLESQKRLLQLKLHHRERSQNQFTDVKLDLEKKTQVRDLCTTETPGGCSWFLRYRLRDVGKNFVSMLRIESIAYRRKFSVKRSVYEQFGKPWTRYLDRRHHHSKMVILAVAMVMEMMGTTATKSLSTHWRIDRNCASYELLNAISRESWIPWICGWINKIGTFFYLSFVGHPEKLGEG